MTRCPHHFPQELYAVRSVNLTSDTGVTRIAGTGTDTGISAPTSASTALMFSVNALALIPNETALYIAQNGKLTNCRSLHESGGFSPKNHLTCRNTAQILPSLLFADLVKLTTTEMSISPPLLMLYLLAALVRLTPLREREYPAPPLPPPPPPLVTCLPSIVPVSTDPLHLASLVAVNAAHQMSGICVCVCV